MFLTPEGPWHPPLAARLWVVPQSPSPAARSRAFRCSSRPRRVAHTCSSTSATRFEVKPGDGAQWGRGPPGLFTTHLDRCGRYGYKSSRLPRTLQSPSHSPGSPSPTAGLGTSRSGGIRGLQRLSRGCPAPLPPSHGDLCHVRPGRRGGFSI